MSIQVTCPGCHTRFRVGDQHAGKEGACPKCKGAIKIPKLSEKVVVHAPKHSEQGALDSKGRPVLKPVARKDTKFQPIIFVAVSVATLVLFGLAWFMRGSDPGAINVKLVMAIGAVLLGPPLAWAGYAFLRDLELEGYTGRGLWIRTVVCGLTYAILWGIFLFVKWKLFGGATGDESAVIIQAVILAVPFFGVGTFAAYVTYDLEPSSAFFHYALYVLATTLLALTLGMSIL